MDASSHAIANANATKSHCATVCETRNRPMTGRNSSVPKIRRCVVDGWSPAINLSGQAPLVGQRGYGLVDVNNPVATKTPFPTGKIAQSAVQIIG